MACPALHFTSISAAVFREISNAFCLLGIPIRAERGQVKTKDGHRIEWSYNDQVQELNLRCLESPLPSCEAINSRLRHVVEVELKIQK